MERSFKTMGRIAAERNEAYTVISGPESNYPIRAGEHVTNHNKHARMPQQNLQEKE